MSRISSKAKKELYIHVDATRESIVFERSQLVEIMEKLTDGINKDQNGRQILTTDIMCIYHSTQRLLALDAKIQTQIVAINTLTWAETEVDESVEAVTKDKVATKSRDAVQM